MEKVGRILFISFRWNDPRLYKHSSDYMIGLAFKRLGWDISYYDYREKRNVISKSSMEKEIYEIIMGFNPDIIFINKGEGISPEIIKKARRDGYGGIVTGFYADQRRSICKCVLDIQSVSDLFFHCKMGDRMEEYDRLSGVKSYFLFAPYEKEFIHNKPFSTRTTNLSWFGQIYHETQGWDNLRETIIPKIRTHLDEYHACFDKGFIRGDEYYASLGNSKVSINIPAIDMSMYFSNRLSHIMGSGCVPLTYKFIDYDRIFTHGVNSISFSSSEELIKELYNYMGSLEAISIESTKFAERYMDSDRVAEEILYVIKNRRSSYSFLE